MKFSKKEIIDFVRTEDLNGQSIRLPYGIKTRGDSRSEAIELVLGELKNLKQFLISDLL